ncbi:DndE family protein [Salisediminibacterium beveridgei]|uniref:DndE family protein n=1 Tax=Salisediminibacterium beveridgei TaxID=632773 RepID=UPI00084827BB|nr:DndE family protein [Salisediminibacterium beveridgei]
MGTPRMHINYDAYEVINDLKNHLNCERPQAIEIAFAKGMSSPENDFSSTNKSNSKKWEVPVNIIKGDKYTLYKALIIEELKEDSLTEDELKNQFVYFIEKGAAIIKLELNRLNDLTDYRIAILNQDR